jgi:outer membrane protein, multidrug efflux system
MNFCMIRLAGRRNRIADEIDVTRCKSSLSERAAFACATRSLRIVTATLAALIVGVTGGCSLAPEYTRPALPVADVYPADAPLSAQLPGARAAAEIAWQDYFADAQMQAVIAQALEYNRDLRLAVLRVFEARAYYQIRRADQFPTLNGDAQAFRWDIPDGLSSTGSSRTASVYSAGLSVPAWELDFWGRVRNLKQTQLEQFLATDASRQAVTVSLVANVADAYLTLRELDERIVLARETIRTREESFRIFQRRFEAGSTTALDVAQVETLLTQAQTLGAQLEQARATTAHALTLLVGTQPQGLAEQAGLNDAALLHDLRVGLPSDLLVQRPDILAAENRLRAANANIGAARAAFFPRIALTGAAGTASDDLSGLFESATGSWLFWPQLVAPIFDAGRRHANLDLAEVRRDAAVAEYELTVQTAFREVSDALSAQRWLAEQVAIQRRALAAQQQRSRLSQMRYDQGSATFLEVLDAQRDLLSSEQSLVELRRELMSSRVSLYAALGGSSQHYGELPPANSRY